MSITYKPSMFNYICDKADDILIYNSYIGIKSVTRISSKRKEEVLSALKGEFLSCSEDVLNVLFSRGFLVDEKVNEIYKRNALYSKYINGNTLLLVIHTTKKCNFRCPYCNLDYPNEELSMEAEEGIEKFVQRNLVKYSDVQIDWFGGEPTLNIDKISRLSEKLIGYCRRVHKPFRATITTNGYLLQPKNVKLLIDANVKVFSITVDGLPDTHNKQRVLANGGATHSTIIENLLYIRDHIKNHDVRIVIRTNITKTIMSQIDQYYAYYNDMFGNDSRFSLLVRPAENIGGERVDTLNGEFLTQSEYNDVLLRLSKIVRNDGIQFANNFEDLDPCGFSCPAILANKYTIGVDGGVSKCDAIFPEAQIGYLSKDGTLHFEGASTEEDWIAGCFKEQPECDKCFFSVCCFKESCPLDRLRGGEFKCHLDTTEIDANLLLYAATHDLVTI